MKTAKAKPKESNGDEEKFYQRQQFFLAPDMIAFLRKESSKINRSRAAIVRTAIRLYAKQYRVILAPERFSPSQQRRYASP